MYIFKTRVELIQFLTSSINSSPYSVGFVPTMGALHTGHISLIERSKLENNITVCSIFVNPTQFNDKNDFTKYPITIEADIEKLLACNTDVLFLPNVEEMYPDGMDHLPCYDIGYLDTVLDGKYRPGHFNGVSLIVHRLLDIVKPTKLYLGEKDFQQCLVIKRMVALQNLNVEVITCPTLRELDGLAMSSRNARLSVDARKKATAIYTCLQLLKEEFKTANFDILQKKCLHILESNGFNPEYLLLAIADNLELINDFDFEKKMVVLIAAHLDGVRLIDNMRLN